MDSGKKAHFSQFLKRIEINFIVLRKKTSDFTHYLLLATTGSTRIFSTSKEPVWRVICIHGNVLIELSSLSPDECHKLPLIGVSSIT